MSLSKGVGETDYEKRQDSNLQNEKSEGGETASASKTSKVYVEDKQEEARYIAETSETSPVERESTEASVSAPTLEEKSLIPVCETRELKKEEVNRPFECTECVASFFLVEDLFLHMKMHSEERPHRCKFCGAAFTHIGNLKRHTRRHTGEKPYKCSVCDAAFAQKEHLKNHTKIHTDEKPHKCSYCDAAFAHTGNLKRHTRTHTGEKPYKCLICGVAFTQKEHLKNHSKICSGERPHKCSYCDAAFSRIRLLKDHIRIIHIKEKQHKCTECSAAFTRLEQLNCHVKVHRGQHPIDLSKCEDGPTSLEFNGALDLMTHSGIKPHQCRHCDAAFSSSGELKIHIRTHTKERPHTCTFCGATFSHTGNLKRHVRTHTGEKPYKCFICQAAFTQKEHLKSHTKTHADEKVKKCSKPDAAFLHDELLNDHTKPHTGEKLHKCPICEATFSTLEDLECHSTKHIGERPYEYPMCDAEPAQNEPKYDRTDTADKSHDSPYYGALVSQTGLLGNVGAFGQDKPFQCSVCNALFPKEIDLKNHSRAHIVSSSYNWSQFDASFSSVNGLESHEMHVGEKPYKCNSSFSFAKSLSEHAKLQPYECTVCHANFSYQGGLNEHMRKHTGENSDSCYLWRSTLSQAEGLKQHFRTHVSEWPYKYTFTNNAFLQSGSLDEDDVRLPSGEHPYKCTVCCAVFSVTKNLKEHVKTHTGEQLFACSVCNKSFSQTLSLKKHVRTHVDQIYNCAVTSLDLMKYMALYGNQLPKPFVNVPVGRRLGEEPANAWEQNTPGGSKSSVSENLNVEIKVKEHNLNEDYRSGY